MDAVLIKKFLSQGMNVFGIIACAILIIATSIPSGLVIFLILIVFLLLSLLLILLFSIFSASYFLYKKIPFFQQDLNPEHEANTKITIRQKLVVLNNHVALDPKPEAKPRTTRPIKRVPTNQVVSDPKPKPKAKPERVPTPNVKPEPKLEAQKTTRQRQVPINPVAPLFVYPLLPPTDKKTLFIDLDKTLILSSTSPHPVNQFPRTEQFELRVGTHTFFVVKRPYVRELLFLAEAHYFEIVIFTASSRFYASPILDWLDPNGEISHRLYKDSCSKNADGRIFKDLDIMGRPIDRCVVIDDHPKVFWKHRDNVINVKPFHGDRDDIVLRELLRFFPFEQYHNCSDIRDSVSLFLNSIFMQD